MVTIEINGRKYTVEEGRRLLEILKEEGIRVPHLCFHHALVPAASCRLCVVELKQGGRPPKTRLACVIKVQEGMQITTESAMVHRMRNEAIGNLLKMAPHSEVIHKIGMEFGLTTGLKPDGCIRCRLCVRACTDIIGAGALAMVRREGLLYVVPSESGSCIGCGTCVNICPTGAIQAKDTDNVRSIFIRDEIIGEHVLKRCEICGSHFATVGFLNYVREREGDHPEEKESQCYCPTCAKLQMRRKLRITVPKLDKTHAVKPNR
jgi:NADH dehydrogenase/NADH:ubiquinone oxidoreductase subunit G